MCVMEFVVLEEFAAFYVNCVCLVESDGLNELKKAFIKSNLRSEEDGLVYPNPPGDFQ